MNVSIPEFGFTPVNSYETGSRGLASTYREIETKDLAGKIHGQGIKTLDLKKQTIGNHQYDIKVFPTSKSNEFTIEAKRSEMDESQSFVNSGAISNDASAELIEHKLSQLLAQVDRGARAETERSTGSDMSYAPPVAN